VIATDGVVTLRAPVPDNVELLVANRDEEFFKWFGPGATGLPPVACIWVDERLVGFRAPARAPGSRHRAHGRNPPHPPRQRPLALAHRLGFVQRGEVDGEPFFTRSLR
jgi:hypothetical protein